MPPLSLLSQRDALDLAKQASADFPGLLVILQPVITPRPLTDDLTITGWVLIVAGVQGRSPWFECRDALDYEHLYDCVFAHYDAARALATTPIAVEEMEEMEPVAECPVPAFLPGHRAPRATR